MRSFSYRAGVRVDGSVLAFDSASATSGSDLVFLSHAHAFTVARDAPERAGMQRLPRARSGRRKILTTETTLALLGPAGARLRPHALTAPYGRPFNLGDLRLELFPSGHLPGSASLLCEREGRRLVYAGTVGSLPPPGAAATAGPGQRQMSEVPEVRQAEALCIDGRFGSPRFAFPERDDALASIRAFVGGALADGRTPVVLGGAEALLLIGQHLPGPASDSQGPGHRIILRAHRHVVAAAAAYRQAGLPVPALARFAGVPKAGDVLLWPPDGRDAPILRTIALPAFIFASGWAADPGMAARMRADAAVPLSTSADFAGLLRYVEATAAREVAVQHAAADSELCQELRRRGIDAYPVGPPEQIELSWQSGASGPGPARRAGP